MLSPLSSRARTAPPLHRGAMTPSPWFGFWRGLLFALWIGLPSSTRREAPWQRAASRRRALLLALITAIAGAAAMLRINAGPSQAGAVWWATTALMTLLFAWVGVGCATAVIGLWAGWRGDRFAPALRGQRGPIDPLARTAIVMPICNEDIATVFAGLRATCESLAATGALKLFDVFVLSDTADPALRAAEQRAWQRLCTMLGEPADGSGRVFYRWRRRRVKRKAGNVADFCRRWGRNYRYMVVLDADSTMSGDTLVQLVRLMEQHPRAGIMQTLPQVANPATLHARAQHFASRVTGRLLALGLAWWQLGDAHYWGHNAILRVEPFMRHCGLARLPGRGGLAGEILSHDFVEAALMGRMGYEVWLVPELGGSWEQTPSNLIDELQRDRRWCQGNLQNLRLVAEPGWRGAHRTMFAIGALSYCVAPLWLVYMALSFSGGGHTTGDAPLWVLTLVLLLLPRVSSVAAIVLRGEAAVFGGAMRLALGTLLELVLSTLQAPLRMLAHSMFVLSALTGLKLEWKSPPRAAEAPGWIGRAVQRIGLLGTPEERTRPRPLLRVAECRGFGDLMPAPAMVAPGAILARGSARRGGLRLAQGAVMAAAAVVALAVPRSGMAPELSPDWRAELQLEAFSSSATEAQRSIESPQPRKRLIARERPARMIDDALRRRALQAVKRAMATQESPA